MLIPRSGLSIVIATGLTIIAFGAQVGATELHLKDPPPPTFSWGIFGPSGVESITAQDYRNTDGTAGGPIIVLNTHILDVDRDPNERDPLEGGKEDIGIATFQFALWRGSTMGAAGAIDTVGAAFMGGFELTDLTDVGNKFSFLQIFTDNADPEGTIDGGGFRGKVNSDISSWHANPADPTPGWNFDGNRTQFDYLDVPSDPLSKGLETVSFETALVNYSEDHVDIIADFTWGFTSDGMGGVSGMQVAEQVSSSDLLLGHYRAKFPGITYLNIGEGSSHGLVVPEPAPIMLVPIGVFTLALYLRRRRVADSTLCCVETW